MSSVRLHGLRKRYGAKQALVNLDLSIAEGEFFVLLGPSGCGKTTALRCIAGLEEPDDGSIVIGDALVTDPAEGRFVPPEKRQLGMVFQSYALWPHMSVGANVRYPLRVRGWSSDAARKEARDALERVRLGEYEHRFPGELSGGQQQRVALARAIVGSPGLVLFDEPLSNVDAQLREHLRDDLRRVHRETRHTAVYVTHDRSEALALADRVAVLKDGRIEQTGTASEIFLTPRTRFIAEFVGYENVLPGVVGDSSGDGLAIDLASGHRIIAGTRDQGFARGAQVAVAIRAGSLALLEPDARSSVNTLEASLVEASYLGDAYRCELTIAEGHTLIANVPAHAWLHARPSFQDRTLRVRLPSTELVVVAA